MKRALTEQERIERAELMQSVKALFIPLALFLSCVIFSGGVFLIYNNESFGWVFIGITGLLAITAFIALVKFQNPYRAKGIITRVREESEVGAE
ncbi:MAG: hypothetical protein K2X93_19595 [Candidatus Obscuribacterales bacterium]|nr:hypothetical protein [Candidatus Obscuribacterales bacterium]